jgi:intraflagellar transport protein 80
VDKVQFVSHIKQLPSPERRNAELALFCHQPQQAEVIYLQAGLPFRAIELNMNLFNWERYLLTIHHPY